MNGADDDRQDDASEQKLKRRTQRHTRGLI